MTRNADFNSEDIDALNKMNEYIIEQHNQIVSQDDIVIMLGDFSFSQNYNILSKFVSRLNGHKYLVLGNHDNADRIDLYLRAGFEDVYRYPIQFNGNYYSHYPLNASIESNERPNCI